MIARLLCLLAFLAAQTGAAPLRVLDAKMYRLGAAGAPEWFDSPKPDAVSVEITFDAERNAGPWTLFIRQAGVKFARPVLLNGKRLGALAPTYHPLVHTLTIPAGLLQDGSNTLSIPPSPGGDDVEVGDFRIAAAPPGEVLRDASVEVSVTEDGAGLPCRITITDEAGALAALHPHPGQRLAPRPGVVYTPDGMAKIGLLPGRYTFYASRGFEYGVDTQTIAVTAGSAQRVPLAIRREVPTPGLVSSDTHIHTLTFSKHGDATIEERMLTIAGEGIELPIATDHNTHADYRQPAAGAGVQGFFTPVMGNEVTTKVGHFNAFPIEPGSAVAGFTATAWPDLTQGMRATPGVRVVTLNHPRDEHSKFIPLGPGNFNPVSGQVLFSPGVGFDAIEVVTSGAMQSDIMQLYRDWFALLNHGHRLTAIAASDTHDVARFILGQARTYVACDDRDAAAIDIDTVCESFIKGRVLVSMGLLTELTVNGQFRAGDLASGVGDTVTAAVVVRGPSWTRADRVELFANGIKIHERSIKPTDAIEKARVEWTFPRPRHDVHLVAVATGPGISAPYCDTPRPYQPVSKKFTPRVIGSTNPVWIDADADGKFSSARAYAEAVIARTGPAAAKLVPALAGYDEAVSVQAAALCHASGADLREFTRMLESAAQAVRAGFTAFMESLK